MLSKSQARLFFLGGTVLFSLLFLFLTVDTVRQVPDQTKQNELTDAAKRGKHIWDENNCMGCHTILGEGAYYAPELTKAYERRGEEWLKVFLKDPQAMYPGRRKMVQYNFEEGEIEDVIAFLKWIGNMDLNGFPAEPTIETQTASIVARDAGEPAIDNQPPKFKTLCVACHSLGGSGGVVGPALDGVGNRYDAAYLEKWLSDPQKLKPGTAMPKLPLTQDEIQELIEFLTELK